MVNENAGWRERGGTLIPSDANQEHVMQPTYNVMQL